MNHRLSAPWWGGAALLLVGLVACLLWLTPRVRWAPRPALPSARIPSVHLADPSSAGLGSAWAESAALLGPAPLFLPTAVNASEVEPPAGLRREPGAQTATFAPRFWHTEQALVIDTELPLPAVSTPAESLGIGVAPPLWATFGEGSRPSVALAARVLRIEVSEAAGGAEVWSVDWPSGEGEVRPPTGDWRPLEFILAVAPSGEVGLPVLVHGSGLAEWDTKVQDSLLRQTRLGLRLWPGLYSIRVGP